MFPPFEGKKPRAGGHLDRFLPRPDPLRLDSPAPAPRAGGADSPRQSLNVFSPSSNVLRYHSRDSRRGENSSLENSAGSARSKQGERRQAALEKKPFRVVPAPGLLDDYYLNLLAWGRAGLIALGLGATLHYHNFTSGETAAGFAVAAGGGSTDSLEGGAPGAEYVSSVGFDDAGRRCAVGDSRGGVTLVDVERGPLAGATGAHGCRVSALHWQRDLLATGSRDSLVKLFDTRSGLATPVTAFAGHLQEVCGVRVSPSEALIASGGNDNLLNVWDIRQMRGLASLGAHDAAVKALAWHPKQANVLLSGAGTADRHIRLFDTAQLAQTFCADTGAQVCSAEFDAEGQHLVTTHGYSLNQLMLWECGKEPQKIDCLIAHKVRVLFLGLSPCGKYAATAAGDESMRIWKIARAPRAGKQPKSLFSAQAMRIR